MSAFPRLLRPVAVTSGLLLALGLVLGAQSGKQQMVPHFEWDPTWPKPLAGGRILGNVIGVAMDAQDHIWVLNRPSSITEQERGAGFTLPDAPCCFPAAPVIEFDQAGTYIQGWGGHGPGYTWVDSEHGIFVDHKDNVWIGSPSDSHLLKFSRSGTFLLQLGEPGHKESTSANPKILGGPAPWVDPPIQQSTHPINSNNPSTTAVSSSSETRPSRRPMRSVDTVRIWLVFAHERFGNFGLVSSSVRGNPARGS